MLALQNNMKFIDEGNMLREHRQPEDLINLPMQLLQYSPRANNNMCPSEFTPKSTPKYKITSNPKRNWSKKCFGSSIFPSIKIKNKISSSTSEEHNYETFELPSYNTIPVSFLGDSDCKHAKLRTSEQEPSVHQIEAPTSEEVLIYSRVCALLENYREVDPEFDFTSLIGMSTSQMNEAIKDGLDPLINTFSMGHAYITKDILECTSDLVVEGFFSTGSEEEDDRTEVAVLKSEALRTFIVVWRGTTIRQKRPVRKKEKHLRALHKDHPTPVLAAFRQSYFQEKLEKKVFSHLHKLMGAHPFFDLLVTGYSFGAGLATICASRYATLFPMIRVSCVVFGSPKIGGNRWRQDVHSLPNLKVIRIQNGGESWTDNPSDSSLVHVGHTIVLEKANDQFHADPAVDAYRITAFKFDKRPYKAVGGFFGNHRSYKRPKYMVTKGLLSYVIMMEQIREMNGLWVTEFAGEDVGQGVKGIEDENRQMV